MISDLPRPGSEGIQHVELIQWKVLEGSTGICRLAEFHDRMRQHFELGCGVHCNREDRLQSEVALRDQLGRGGLLRHT